MYKAAQAEGGAEGMDTGMGPDMGAAMGDGGTSASEKPADDNVVDADFEEVDPDAEQKRDD